MKKILLALLILLLFSFGFATCVLEADEDENSSSSSSSENASGSDFSASNAIYIDLTNAKVSSDNENWAEITTTSTDFFDETVKVKYTQTDSGESTGVIRVDAADATENLAVYLSGTQTSGGVKIQTTTEYEVGVYLDNVSITSTNYPCLDMTKGGAASVFLTGTNTLNDGRNYSSDYSSYSDNKGTLYCKGGLALVSSNGTGTLTITQNYKSCIATKANLSIESGTYTLTSTAVATYDSTEGDYNSPACINVDGNMTVSGGTVTGTANGNGSKGLKVDGTYTQSDGTVGVDAQGSNIGSSGNKFLRMPPPPEFEAGLGFAPAFNRNGGRFERAGRTPPGSEESAPGATSTSTSSASASAKGVKVNGAISITGGKLYAKSASHEAIESKSTIDITGGEVYGKSDADDGINAASHFTISGGYVCGYAVNNDGLDSNGNLYIKGGVVYAIGSTSPEKSIDANTEGGYKLYISGGVVMALGPLEDGSSLTQNCYSASSWSEDTTYGLTVGDTVYTFKTPSSTSGYGSGIVVSGSSIDVSTALTSGATAGSTTYFDDLVSVGGSAGSTSVSLSSYSSSSSGGSMGGNSSGFGGGPNRKMRF